MDQLLNGSYLTSAYQYLQSLHTKGSSLETRLGPIEAYRLGFSYKEGLGVEPNNKKAFFYFKQAADQHYAEAQFELGIMFNRGIGCIEDQLKGVDYFERAAEQGYVVAKCYAVLAKMHKAVGVFRAESPNTWLTFSEGLLSRGWSIVPAYCEEMMECELSVIRLCGKCIEAYFIYAWLNRCQTKQAMETGMVKKFHDEMTACAALGYAPAQYQLGLMEYEIDKERDKEREKAVNFFRQAACQGYAPAQYQLSLLLKAIPEQQEESRQYLMQAASQQYPLALNELAHENNKLFQLLAVRGQLYDGLGNGETNLLPLPQEIAEKITSYIPDPLKPSPPNTWFDDMYEMIRWDNRGFKPTA